MAILRSDTFDHLTQFVEHSWSNFHPAMIVHQDQMQVVPVLSMGTADGLTQIDAGISLLILQEQILDSRIGHAVTVHLFRDIIFDHGACRSTDAADCIVALECFGVLFPDKVLKSPFNAANHC